MPQKFSYEKVKKIFEDANCKLISDDYVSSKKKLQYVCECHMNDENPPIYEVSLATFMIGIRCRDCRQERLKATNMERYGYEYLSQNSELKERVLSGIMKYVQDKKLKLDDLKIIYEEAGCKLLATEYINCTVKMPFICMCGKEYNNSYNDFRIGQRCGFLECINKRKEDTCMRLYGETNYSKTDESKERIKKISQEKYGHDHHSQNKEYNLAKFNKEYYFQTDEFKQKVKAKCLLLYNLEFYSQVESVKEKIRNANMIKYGFPVSFQNLLVKEKIKKTNIEKYGVPYPMMNKEIKDKANKRVMDVYNVDNVSQVPSIRDKMKENSLHRYGTLYPMQNSIISERSQNNMKKFKEYIMPSGKILKVQGFEPFALNNLLKTYNENDIYTNRTDMPEIWYYMNSSYKRYFPDIYIPKDNLIIEVKSIWTYDFFREEVKEKRKATQYLGFNYELRIYDKNGGILNFF